MELGERVRALRNERGLSLEELAKRSGVALGTLSNLENARKGTTYKTLQKIVEALGVTQVELYRGLEAPKEEAVLVEPESKEAQTYTYDEKASSMLLTTQVSKKKMMPQMIVLQPGGSTTKDEYPKGTERWLFGLEGQVEAKVGEQTYRISKGGTLYLDASVPHQFLNADKRGAAKLISVTNPVVL